MFCKKCGAEIMNGERQCKQCGVELSEGRGPAVMTERRRPVHAMAQRPVSRLAVCFFILSAAGLAFLLLSGALVAVIDRSLSGSNAAWNLGLLALTMLTIGFLFECVALIFGVLAAIALSQEKRLKGGKLAGAGALLWIVGAAVFVLLRTNPHFRPTIPALGPPSAARPATHP